MQVIQPVHINFDGLERPVTEDIEDVLHCFVMDIFQLPMNNYDNFLHWSIAQIAQVQITTSKLNIHDRLSKVETN